MDKVARKTYRYILKCHNHFLSFPYDERLLPVPVPDFAGAIKYLCRCGYAVIEDGGVRITHEGIHKREIERRAFWRLFFTRWLPGFLAGIVSSVLATLIANYILSLYG